MAVESGCIGVCSTLFDEVCQGCGRTRDEVDQWVFMSEEEQRAAVARAAAAGTALRFKRVQF
jgi:predicted Fe-S protein YdhL (DUF1289 family)